MPPLSPATTRNAFEHNFRVALAPNRLVSRDEKPRRLIPRFFREISWTRHDCVVSRRKRREGGFSFRFETIRLIFGNFRRERGGVFDGIRYGVPGRQELLRSGGTARPREVGNATEIKSAGAEAL